jgi:threonine/homoserine/homoserine lactone efflux protein
MTALASLLLLIALAAITPGPNNFIVLAESASRGIFRTVPVMVAIAAASGAMLLLVTGLVTFVHIERLFRWIALLGSSLLAFMAIGQWLGASRPHTAGKSPRVFRPATVALLQPPNPKAWILVIVVAGAARATGLADWVAALLVVSVSFACSLCWAALGRPLSRCMEQPSCRLWLRRTLSFALLATAIELSLSQLEVIQ